MASLRVGTLNQLLFGGALLLLSGVLITDTASIISQRHAAQRTAEVSRAGNDLFAALKNLRTERGPTRIALQAAQPALPGTLGNFAKARQAAAPAMETFLATCQKIACAPSADLDAIRSAYGAVQALRQDVDRDLASPLDKRAEGIAERWNKGSTALIDLLERMSGKLLTAIRLVDPIIGELVAIKNAGWTVRDYAGLVRNYYGDAIQANSLSPALQAKMIDHEARIDSAWTQLLDLTSRPGAPAAVVDAVKKAHSDYIDRFSPMLTGIRSALAAGKPAPIGVDAMMSATTAGLTVLMDVPQAALATCVDYAESRVAAATRRLVIELAVFALAVAVGLAGILVIRRRIARPIDGIVQAMQRVADGHLDSTIPYADRQDEIGELAGALGVFKANAVEKERLADQQRQAQALREQRQAEIEAAIGEFQDKSEHLLDFLLRRGAPDERQLADHVGHRRADHRGKPMPWCRPPDQTSINVQTVAAATEELSASISEIGRQVAQSARDRRPRRRRGQAHRSRPSDGLAERRQTHRRRGAADQRHRQPDQSSGLERHHRGGARRRSRQGLRRGGRRGQDPGQPDRPGHRRDRARRSPRCRAATARGGRRRSAAIGRTIGEISEIATAIASAVEEQGAATQRDRPQRPAGRAEHPGGHQQYRRRQPGRRTDRRRRPAGDGGIGRNRPPGRRSASGSGLLPRQDPRR